MGQAEYNVEKFLESLKGDMEKICPKCKAKVRINLIEEFTEYNQAKAISLHAFCDCEELSIKNDYSIGLLYPDKEGGEYFRRLRSTFGGLEWLGPEHQKLIKEAKAKPKEKRMFLIDKSRSK